MSVSYELGQAATNLFRAHAKIYRLWVECDHPCPEKEILAGMCSTLNNLLVSLAQLQAEQVRQEQERETEDEGGDDDDEQAKEELP